MTQGREFVGSFVVCLAIGAVVPGCGASTVIEKAAGPSDDDTTMPDLESDGGGETSTGDSDDDAGDDSGTDENGSGDAAESDGSSGGQPACGNGVVEAEEQCDDDSEACRSDCSSACSLATLVVGTDKRVYTDVALSPDGELIALGRLVSDTEGTLQLSRLSDDGEVVEQMERAFEAPVFSDDLHVDDDGSIYAMIYAELDGAPQQLHLMHWTADGTEAWTHTPSDMYPSWYFFPPSMVGLPEGGVAMVATVDPVLAGDRNFWIGGYDADGLSFERQYSSTPLDVASRDYGSLLVVDGDGTLTAAGSMDSAQGGSGVHDPLVARLGDDDEPAAWSWSQFLGATNLTLLPRGAAQLDSGRTVWMYQQSHSSSISQHFTLFALDPDGSLAWTLDSDALGDDARTADTILHDGLGHLFISGGRIDPEHGGAITAEHITALDADGNVLCDDSVEPSGGDFTGVTLSAAGQPVLVGATSSFKPSGVHPTFARVRGFEGP